MGRTLTQARQLHSRILAKYDDPNYQNTSLDHWTENDLHQPGENRRHKDGDLEYSIVEDWALLDEIYDDLNRILFEGVLSVPDVSWSIAGKNDHRDEWERYAHELTSMTIDPRAKPNGTRNTCKPRIMLWERPDWNDRNQRMVFYIELLLHGMIHAFLIRYTCNCIACKDKYIQVEYKTGHGIVWQQIARDIEKFCKKRLAITVDLQREKAMAEEWYSYRGVLDKKLCEELELNEARVRIILNSLEESGFAVPLPFYHGTTRTDGNPVDSMEDVVVLR